MSPTPEYTLHRDPIDDRVLSAVWDLVQICFDPEPGLRFADRLEGKLEPLVVLAMAGDETVGFKLGYALNELEFYSWLGGVHPDHRRRGVATELMRRQHAWCKENGYAVVRTETLPDNAPMIALNLRYGFEAAGTRVGERGERLLFARVL